MNIKEWPIWLARAAVCEADRSHSNVDSTLMCAPSLQTKANRQISEQDNHQRGEWCRGKLMLGTKSKKCLSMNFEVERPAPRKDSGVDASTGSQ